MRFEILAFAALAATASADDATTCGTWKYGVYAMKTATGEGWTLENTADNAQIYKDGNGNAITDWSAYTGYDNSKCAEAAAAAAAAADDDEDDGAAYLATGAALAAFAATLAL